MSTLSLLLSTVLAYAPTAAPEPTNNEDADQAARVGGDEGSGTSVYEFAGDELTGEHLKPDGSLIPWRRPPHHESLIDLRGFFTPELVKLALDV